jgi:hypothetical protein
VSVSRACILLVVGIAIFTASVSAVDWFSGGSSSISGCSNDQQYCFERIETISSRPDLAAIGIKYNIEAKDQSALNERVILNWTLWRVNYTRHRIDIVYHRPGLIASYQGSERENYLVFPTLYDTNSSNYDYFLNVEYPNPNYNDNTNSRNRAFARFSYNLYKIYLGEDAYAPVHPAPEPRKLQVAPLNQRGQPLSFTITRGYPFTFNGVIALWGSLCRSQDRCCDTH